MFTNLHRVCNGLPIARNKRRRYLAKEATVKNASANLAAGRITIIEFLSTVAALLGRKVNILESAEDDEEDEIDRPSSPTPALLQPTGM